MGGIENGRFVHKLFENKNLIKKNIRINNFQEHPHLYGIASFNKR